MMGLSTMYPSINFPPSPYWLVYLLATNSLMAFQKSVIYSFCNFSALAPTEALLFLSSVVFDKLYTSVIFSVARRNMGCMAETIITI